MLTSEIRRKLGRTAQVARQPSSPLPGKISRIIANPIPRVMSRWRSISAMEWRWF